MTGTSHDQRKAKIRRQRDNWKQRALVLHSAAVELLDAFSWSDDLLGLRTGQMNVVKLEALRMTITTTLPKDEYGEQESES